MKGLFWFYKRKVIGVKETKTGWKLTQTVKSLNSIILIQKNLLRMFAEGGVGYSLTSCENSRALAEEVGGLPARPGGRSLRVAREGAAWRLVQLEGGHMVENSLIPGARLDYTSLEGVRVEGRLERGEVEDEGGEEEEVLQLEGEAGAGVTWVLRADTVTVTTRLAGVMAREVYRPDLAVLYSSSLHTTLRPFIDTKLPLELLQLPQLQQPPVSWCSCVLEGRLEDQDLDEDLVLDDVVVLESDPECSVHGWCEECEKMNGDCYCDWFYDSHYCRDCGLTLDMCECNHVLEIRDRLYSF